MLSRDLIQGFIDGYITAGGDPAQVGPAINQYVTTNPTYAVVADASATTVDVSSYRITPQAALAPSPVILIPSKAVLP